jgi:hypothetical protein
MLFQAAACTCQPKHNLYTMKGADLFELARENISIDEFGQLKYDSVVDCQSFNFNTFNYTKQNASDSTPDFKLYFSGSQIRKISKTDNLLTSGNYEVFLFYDANLVFYVIKMGESKKFSNGFFVRTHGNENYFFGVPSVEFSLSFSGINTAAIGDSDSMPLKDLRFVESVYKVLLLDGNLKEQYRLNYRGAH